MKEMPLSPSGATWTENSTWYAMIRMYVDDKGNEQVILRRSFATELEAIKWRIAMIDAARNASIQIITKRQERALTDEQYAEGVGIADALWAELVMESEITSFDHEIFLLMPPEEIAKKIIEQYFGEITDTRPKGQQ